MPRAHQVILRGCHECRNISPGDWLRIFISEYHQHGRALIWYSNDDLEGVRGTWRPVESAKT
jgi:hypothetical protein